MKHFSIPTAYSNFINATKTYVLLVCGGIGIFSIICLLQLLSFFNQAHSSVVEKNIVVVTTHPNKVKPTIVSATTSLKKNIDVSTTIVKPAPESLKNTALSAFELNFLQQNKKRNHRIIKYLGGITEMQEFRFDKNSSSLNNLGAMNRLDSIAQICVSNPDTWSRIVLLGFTDGKGSKYGNVKLGLERAAHLKQMLVKKGIPANKIVIASFGSDLPIANNNTEEGRSTNRRVEFNLLGNS